MQTRFRLNRHLKNCHVVLGSFLLFVMSFLASQSFSQPLAKGRSKFLGCSTSSDIWRNLALYWNQVTPGDAGKWGSVEAVRGQPNWANLDNIYYYAVNRSLPFKEHTLVWGNQQPSWITSLDSSDQRAAVENWIHLVGDRYRSMSFADVVNEPINGPAAYKKALGGDGTTGWDWVITAFQLARQACAPGVKLILNEYNVLHSNTTTTTYLNIINLLKDRRLIDGIGVQGHYFEFRSHVGATSNTYVWDITTIKYNLNRLTATGLPVYMTEFDIDEPVDSIQLAQYKIYFPIFWNNPGVKGITLWGYIQSDVWSAHPDTYLLRDDGTERSALGWLRTYVLTPLTPVPVSPSGTTGEPRNPRLLWLSSDSATLYHIQVSVSSGFASAVVDTTVADTLLQLSALAANTTYYWRVSAANAYGTSEYSVAKYFTTGDQVVAAHEPMGTPGEYNLSQNYANPFNPTTTIAYDLPTTSFVSLKVYNVLGKEVSTLVNATKSPGRYSVQFDVSGLSSGVSSKGEYASGVYFYRLQAGNRTFVKKMMLLK
jgi:endo-1,4-beta-xylanase